MPRCHLNKLSLCVLCFICALAGGFTQPVSPSAICSRLQLPANRLVVDVQSGDVTGDSVADVVVLVGDRPFPGSHIAGTHDLIIIDGKTGAQTTLSLGEGSGGHDGSLLLGDFTGDKVDDILVTLPGGGPAGSCSYFLLSAREGIPAVCSIRVSFPAGHIFAWHCRIIIISKW